MLRTMKHWYTKPKLTIKTKVLELDHYSTPISKPPHSTICTTKVYFFVDFWSQISDLPIEDGCPRTFPIHLSTLFFFFYYL